MKSRVDRRERERGLKGVRLRPPLSVRSPAWLLYPEVQRMQGMLSMTTMPEAPEAKAPDSGRRL